MLFRSKSIYDSSVIVEYFDGIGTGANLIPADFAARIAVRQWEALGDGIVDAIVALTHDARYSQTCDAHAGWYQKQLKKIEQGVAALDHDIGANEFCFGNAFGLADICAGMALGYLDRAYGGNASYDWRGKYPGLKRYADKLFARASFANTLPSGLCFGTCESGLEGRSATNSQSIFFSSIATRALRAYGLPGEPSSFMVLSCEG